MGFLILLCVAAVAPDPPEVRFDRLVKQVRDGQIARAAARDALRLLWPEIEAVCRGRCGESSSGLEWVFPLAGYGPEAIGGTRGEGYQPAHFDFFDGNRHRGHPAHDLFIPDRNQDSLDDKTRLPVQVLSVSGGLVVSLDRDWQSGSGVRGGRYVSVYDPATRRLHYYAHLDVVAVDLGACVKPGSPLGTVGRTGSSAEQQRSPTHLHFMVLEVSDGAPAPWNPYASLRSARQIQVAASRAPSAAAPEPYPWPHDSPGDEPITRRFRPPPGFVRPAAAPGSFAAWLAGLPLRPGRPPVMLHNGQPKANQSAHEAVLDVDTGPEDLQQCADAVIRLRAEYLFSQGRYSEIHFNSSSGDSIGYLRWRGGERPKVEGGRVKWFSGAVRDTTYAGFRRYLRFVFQYAGTASLAAELVPVASIEDIGVGDVFIRGGSPGHAVMVADVALHPVTGRKAFLLLQSYMPAQDVHVLRNPSNPSWSPWYEAPFGASLVTPEWIFRLEELRRFKP